MGEGGKFSGAPRERAPLRKFRAFEEGFVPSGWKRGEELLMSRAHAGRTGWVRPANISRDVNGSEDVVAMVTFEVSDAPSVRAWLAWWQAKPKAARLGLEPAWVEDLLGIWSGSDMRAETSRLGFSPVSPMFERMGESESVDTDAGYSSLEVAAVKAAIDKLSTLHPDEWAAIQRAFRPWVRHEIEGSDDQAVLKTAAWRIAEWIDQALGD